MQGPGSAGVAGSVEGMALRGRGAGVSHQNQE
jgi:hypothetical protein